MGWIKFIKRSRIPLYVFSLKLEGEAKVMGRIWGESLGEALLIIENGIVEAYGKQEENKKLEEYILKKFSGEDFSYFFKRYELGFSIMKKLTKLAKYIQNKYLKEQYISNKYRNKIFSTYCQNYSKLLSFIHMPIIIGIVGTKLLKKYVCEFMGESTDISYILNALTVPSKETCIIKEQRELFKIISTIKKEVGAVNIFIENSNKMEELLPISYPKLDKLISNHSKKYGWIGLGWGGGKIWSRGYFFKLICGCLKDPKLEHKIQALAESSIKRKEQRVMLIKKFKFPEKITRLAKVLRGCAYLNEYRKSTFTYCGYCTISLFKDLAKRMDLKVDYFNFVTSDEIKKFLEANEIPSLKMIKKRKKLCVFYKKNKKIELFTDKRAEIMKDQLVLKNKFSGIKELKGICASPGKTTGRVRLIVDIKEINQIRKGDILVASALPIEYIIAMQKAKGIIMEEGGITCHAAIISRELGVPCIMKTKNATKILKDGDLVEMDASKGLIKKLLTG